MYCTVLNNALHEEMVMLATLVIYFLKISIWLNTIFVIPHYFSYMYFIKNWDTDGYPLFCANLCIL